MEYNSRMSETTPLLNNNVLNNNGNKKQAGKGISQANQHALQKELEVLSQAAEQGGAMSQFILGMCYAEGKGVERNLKKAFDYIVKPQSKAMQRLNIIWGCVIKMEMALNKI